ncbi:nucleotidyltransferase domain-containing protein [Pedobacter caeni]|uniref:Nucleotidyltransferase n=1 Tax=Pedobacter caeni TaxID=288992 RepID=A0A1M5M0Q3_9SPHI|nr:nucleotidyltransferase domain-containing protein [Pedobacter caeni]SHG70912.1 hypothetical protein SAMN04488522_10727 [Pedobacter caeni]
MKTTIVNKLSAIEQEYDLKILFSCESGSRGWQFPSMDSDFDVRFIYIKPLNHYLSILERTDHLSFPINDELDIYGWDLRKVLNLLRKSNTTPFEWLQSPVVYGEEAGFKSRLWHLCQGYFSQRTNAHHYLGIAKGAMDTIVNEDEIKIKKLFYVLRPLLAAKWCLEKNQIAPMEIGPLMDLLPDHLHTMVSELIVFKSTGKEGTMIKIPVLLKDYIDHEFINCTEAAKDLPKNQFDLAGLDDFFLKTINEYDYKRHKG